MRNAPVILGTAWLVLCLAVTAVGMSLRLSPLEKELLEPGFLGNILGPVALVLAAAAVALLWVGGSHARGRNLQVPWAQLILYYPLLFAFIWLVLPATSPDALSLVAGSIFFLVAIVLLIKGPPRPARASWSLTCTILADLAVLTLPVLLGLAVGGKPDAKAAGLSLLLYPLYALIQMVVFLVIPARRLALFGLSPVPAALITAAVFSLVHAPNPVVMAVTFGAMFLWAWQYLCGRRLWHLALVMGLAATLFSQLVPDQMTGHMRVGPGTLHQEAKLEMARRTGEPPFTRIREFLTFAYPQTVGRGATSDELDRWETDLALALRTTRAWQFFTSDEYARKAKTRGWPPGPDEAVHWTAFSPEWRDRIAAFGSDSYWEACGATLPSFTRALYRDILHRDPGDAELQAWTRDLTVGQRWRLTSVLLEEGRQWHSRPYPGLDVDELRLPR